VLREVFGFQRGEVTGEWRKLHNEEHNDLYCSPNIFPMIDSRRMIGARHVARMGDDGGEYGVLVEKPEGKRPLGKLR
jgi:galactose-1-phosphate uridylyltransferase